VRVGVGVYSGGPSGVPVSVLETADALRRAGVDVTLFATSDARVPERFAELDDVTVLLAELPRALRNVRIGHALHLVQRRALGRRLARALEGGSIDVLHLFSPGIATASSHRRPTVVQSWFHPPSLSGRLRTMMPLAPRNALWPAHLAAETQSFLADRIGFRHADLIAANTEPARRALAARGHTAARIPPCISVPDRPPAREPAEVLRLAFCAYNLHSPRKGLRDLLAALPMVDGGPVRLTLVGGWDDSLGEAVEAARHSGVEVQVLGRVARERYLELLASQTDLLVTPSRYEEWGYALLEALSQGVPALAYDVYPFSEILDRDTGLLAPSIGPPGLARGIETALAGMLPPAAAVQASARERFGSATTAKRLCAAYAQLLPGSAS
jgi:glycosyltransferase involved in cell wall biosynthesis